MSIIKLEKWPDSTTCRFVQLYKDHACLWDLECPEYKNQLCRENALAIIQNEMAIENFGRNEIKNKIRTLRSTYNLERLKVEKSLISGPIYRPTMKWFYIMKDIMVKVAQTKKRMREENSYEFDEIPIESGNETNSETDATSEAPDKPRALPAPKRKREVDNITAVLRKHSMDFAKDFLNYAAIDRVDSEACITFGTYVGQQLMKMSTETRIICQLDLQRVLTEALLKEVRDPKRMRPEFQQRPSFPVQEFCNVTYNNCDMNQVLPEVKTEYVPDDDDQEQM